MKTIILLFILCAALFVSGCTTPAQRQQEQVSQGVYATNDAMHVGRFDLAQTYSDGLVKTVAPPKKRIPIKAMYKPANS